MKKFVFITLVCLMVFVSFTAMAQPGQPGQPTTVPNKLLDITDSGYNQLDINFIGDREEAFRLRYGRDFEQAFAARLGYGVGTLTDSTGQQQIFSWFAFTNTDAYLQLYLNCSLSHEQARNLRCFIDDLKRNWGVVNFKDGTSWIGTSNCWMLNDTDKANNLDYDYIRRQLGLTITRMSRESDFIDNMSIIGYYP